MDRKRLAYWLTTGLFALVLGSSGVAHFTHLPMMVEAMTGMGYPLYFMQIIGVAKMLGAVTLLVPGQALLKEWAYAGLAFNLIGATASHAFSGDEFSHTIRPALVLLLGAASYALRPADRRLPPLAFRRLTRRGGLKPACPPCVAARPSWLARRGDPGRAAHR